jgi:hypothetical protein
VMCCMVYQARAFKAGDKNAGFPCRITGELHSDSEVDTMKVS